MRRGQMGAEGRQQGDLLPSNWIRLPRYWHPRQRVKIFLFGFLEQS